MGGSDALERLARRFPAFRALGRGRRRRIPVVRQLTQVDCAAACLAMVLGYHGRVVPLDEVGHLIGATRRGVVLARLLDVARRFGLRGRGVKVDRIEDLRYLGRGAVLHWDFNHFVVLERSTRRGAWIVDPARGRRFVTRRGLGESFTGVAATFEPSEDFEPGGRRRTGVARYGRKLLAQRNTLVRTVVTSLFLQLLALSVPLLTGVVVDRVVPRSDRQMLLVLMVGVGGLALFYLLTTLVRSYLLLDLRTRLDAETTVDFLEHLMDLPYLFFQQRGAGDLITRLNSNGTLREILTTATLSGVLDGTAVIFYLAILLGMSPGLGLVAAGLGALQISTFLFARRRHRDLMSQFLAAQAESRSYQFQLFNGIRMLKGSGAEARALDRWSHAFVQELNAGLERGKVDAVVQALLGTSRTVSPLLLLLFGAWSVIEGQLSLGTMLALNALALGFLQPLSTLMATAFQLQLLGSYVERIDDVLNRPRERDGGEAATSEICLDGALAFDGVTFRYGPGEDPVLLNVSFTVRPGQLVAIVGPSGSGKSTLAALAAGLYLPEEGRIAYDGYDVRQLDLRALRRQLGIVTQDDFLFGSSTIRENIAFAHPDLDLAEVVEAARIACIHDDIQAMPLGYETSLAENGASLSGGQRQRICLARAIVQNPRILILDEATSALDTVTEREIKGRLEGLRCTRLVIAHRLSTVRDADQILVLDRGRIVERGRYDELMERRAAFFRLVAAQAVDGDRGLKEHQAPASRLALEAR